MKPKALLLLAFVCLATFSSPAKVVLPAIFGDHMVMQQQTSAPLWGRADAGEKVTISASWDEMALSTYADSKGKWRIDLATPAAGGPYSIRIEASNLIVIDDILIGEVWLASGQSNMEWTLAKADLGAKEIAAANFPEIRLFKVERDVSSTPRFDCKGEWMVCSPESVKDFSAVGFFFAKQLQKELNVPVAVIQSTWGGTPSEAWTSRPALEAHRSFQDMLKKYDDEARQYRNNPRLPDPVHAKNPTTLYNAMIAPLIPFGIKGFLWYQGESNRYDPYLYGNLFPALIYNWRHDWASFLPFYFVQIAPYKYEFPLQGAGVREAQMFALQLPETGMAVTMDIGNPDDIHPTNKHDVADRLVRWALAKSYGRKDVVYSGPLYEQMSVENGAIRLSFLFAEGGLVAKGGPLTFFQIAGKDRVFYPAKAVIDGETILVSSEKVPEPVAVRFAFGNADMPNLYNQAGLPASSFRTDAWPLFFTCPAVQGVYDRTKDQFQVDVSYANSQNYQLFYTLDGTVPTSQSNLWNDPILVPDGTTVKVRAFAGEWGSDLVGENTFHKHLGMTGTVTYEQPFSTQYAAGGAFALIDGMYGSANFNDGLWQGWEGDDLSVVIDLGEKKDITSITTRFLQNQNQGIFLPSSVVYSLSGNGKKFDQVATFNFPVPKHAEKNEIKPCVKTFANATARYIKIDAKNAGQLPAWHSRSGEKAWILADEMVVE
ncbi:MAG: sialate O-acetylesterase [Bacteroidia bacterium]